LSFHEAAYPLTGLLIGLLVGLTGIGSGAFLTPLLVLTFGIAPATAIGTNLVFTSVTKAAGTVVHGMRGTIDWKVTGGLVAGSIPTALATVLVMSRTGMTSALNSPFVVNLLLGGVLFQASLAVFFRPWILEWAGEHMSDMSATSVTRWTILLGAALGILVVLTTVGAGAVGATALLILHPKLPVARVVGSVIAYAVPMTLIGGLGHLAWGSVDLGLALALLAGSIPGIIIGSLLSSRLSDELLRPALAAALLIASFQMMFA
jgi:uncharacterized membrane protein YfcA